MEELTPLTPDVISRQATINIGACAAIPPRGPVPFVHSATLRSSVLSSALEAPLSNVSVATWRSPEVQSAVVLHSPFQAAPLPPMPSSGVPENTVLGLWREAQWPAAGTIGHVAHGKSTVVKAISGVQTVRFKNELERNITIKLGYANAKIYECECEVCPP